MVGIAVADDDDLAVRDGGGEALELDKPTDGTGVQADSHLPDGDGIPVGGHADKTGINGGDIVVERPVEDELDGSAVRQDRGAFQRGRGEVGAHVVEDVGDAAGAGGEGGNVVAGSVLEEGVVGVVDGGGGCS